MHGPTGWGLHYCNSTHTWSIWLRIALLQQHTHMVHLAEHCIITTAHTRMVHLAEHCIIATAHMHGPTGWALHYCNNTHAWSIWLSIALLQQHTCMVHLAEHCIIATAHLHGPTGWALHYCNNTHAWSVWLNIAFLHLITKLLPNQLYQKIKNPIFLDDGINVSFLMEAAYCSQFCH